MDGWKTSLVSSWGVSLGLFSGANLLLVFGVCVCVCENLLSLESGRSEWSVGNVVWNDPRKTNCSLHWIIWEFQALEDFLLRVFTTKKIRPMRKTPRKIRLQVLSYVFLLERIKVFWGGFLVPPTKHQGRWSNFNEKLFLRKRGGSTTLKMEVTLFCSHGKRSLLLGCPRKLVNVSKWVITQYTPFISRL